MRFFSRYLCLLLFIELMMFGKSAFGKAILFKKENCHEIFFGKIEPNQYRFTSERLLEINVDASSSLLLIPFKSKEKVHELMFSWKAEGNLKLNSMDHAKTKKGDDAILRVGLILLGNKSKLPVFAPKWLQRASQLLHFPVGKIHKLVVLNQGKVGTRWLSPFSDQISLQLVDLFRGEAGFSRVRHRFAQKHEVIGLWVQADGDGTSSQFVTYLKDLELR